MDHRNVVGVYDEEPLRLSVPKALGKVLPLRGLTLGSRRNC
jgi:hypothetical protein